MNHQDSRSVTTAGKTFSPTALTLAVALALGCWNSAALAESKPIPGIDIIVQKKPSGIPVATPTNTDGTYEFTGLAPGEYELTIAGERVQTVSVGANRSISGVLSRGSDGAASLSVNGKTGSVLVGPPGAPINTTRSNIRKPGIAAGEEPQPEGPAGAPINTTRSNIRHPGIAAGEEPLPEGPAGAPINTTRSNIRKPGIAAGEEPQPEGPAGAPINTTRSNIKRPGIAAENASPPGGGDEELPGLLGTGYKEVGSAKHSEYEEVSPGTARTRAPSIGPAAAKVVSDVVKGHPTSIAQGSAKGAAQGSGSAKGARMSANEASASGALEATPQSGGGGAPRPGGGDGELPGKHNPKGIVTLVRGVAPRTDGGDGKAGISDQAAAGGLTSYGTAPPPKGEGEELPGLAGGTIQGTDVGLDHDPGGARVGTTTTDAQGAFHFDNLPAGKYKLTIRGEPPISVSVGGDGKAGGTVMRGPDGSLSIFDRWGNSLTAPQPKAGDVKQDTPDQAGGSKAAESPVSFGSGNNAMGAGPGAGPGAAGMSPPGAAMGGAVVPGPMSPMGGGPMGGSPGGAMRP